MKMVLSLSPGMFRGKVDLITDSDSVESFGADADEIIASSSSSTLAFGQGAGLQTLANFTEKLVGLSLFNSFTLLMKGLSQLSHKNRSSVILNHQHCNVICVAAGKAKYPKGVLGCNSQ